MTDALFFDLDDTLVAYDAVTSISWRQACASLSAESCTVSIERTCQTIQKHSRAYWSDEQRARNGRQDIVSARRTFVRVAFDELGLPSLEAIRIADLFSKIRIDNMYLLPKAAETLTCLREQGLRLALITNGDSEGQRAKVVRFDLAKFFDLILVEGELGFGKPDERIFRKALDLIGSRPEQALMIGDNLVWDVLGAHSVGIKGIWFDWKREGLPHDAPVEPFARITELSQLVELGLYCQWWTGLT